LADRIDGALVERARRSLRRLDPVLGDVIRRVGACELRRRGDPYRYLVRSVLFQQITGAAGTAIEKRLHAALKERYARPGDGVEDKRQLCCGCRARDSLCSSSVRMWLKKWKWLGSAGLPRLMPSIGRRSTAR
jgi:hypothetical protein